MARAQVARAQIALVFETVYSMLARERLHEDAIRQHDAGNGAAAAEWPRPKYCSL